MRRHPRAVILVATRLTNRGVLAAQLLQVAWNARAAILRDLAPPYRYVRVAGVASAGNGELTVGRRPTRLAGITSRQHIFPPAKKKLSFVLFLAVALV
jgi:hypothetical protein